MKHSSKSTQIDWLNQKERSTQLKQLKASHSRPEVITSEQLNESNLNSQNTSLKSIEQNSLATSQEATDSMAVALAEAGITDGVVADKLKDIMDNAFTSTPDGQIIPDFKTMLDCIKVYMKMKSNKPDTQINIANIFWGKGWDL